MVKELGFWILKIMKTVGPERSLCAGQCPLSYPGLQIISNGFLGKLANVFELCNFSDKKEI